jgi:hypothetical protein
MTFALTNRCANRISSDFFVSERQSSSCASAEVFSGLSSVCSSIEFDAMGPVSALEDIAVRAVGPQAVPSFRI